MKIYTKTGDEGFTSLLGGTRRLKSNLRIESYGTIDELNSYIGMLRDQRVNSNKNRTDELIQIQNDLFVIGAELATDPGKSNVKKPPFTETSILKLEQSIDQMDGSLPEMTHFILPGGHQSVSFGHIARTISRRAERKIIALSEEEDVSVVIKIYLNRLSDYLFVLCRWMSSELKVIEVKWNA